MPPTNNATHAAVATLLMPAKTKDLIAYSQNVVTGMIGNPAFPSPTPPLAQVTASINALVSAENLAALRTKGAVTTRNLARTTLVTQLKQLRGYVQSVADADIENGASIIESARFSVRKTAVRAPRVFDAAQGPTTGTAKLVARAAGRRAAYDWEYSVDGGKTWLPTSPTLQAKTVVTGLPAGTAVQFRYRGVTKTGAEDWSTPVTLLVK